MNPSQADLPSDREIRISRVFNAPRDLVWAAMTDPKQVVRWWGPVGFTTTIEEMDFRPGGTWRHVMHGPDGAKYPNRSVFKEIVPPERIVYTHGGAREGGPGVRFTATWTFEALEPFKTRLTIHQVFPTGEMRDFVINEFGAVEGGKQTLGRLDAYLAARPVVIERRLAAPVALVWRALTEIEMMKPWYFEALAEFRAEVGFATQFEVKHDGNVYLHRWNVTEVVPGRRLAYRWRHGGNDGESLVTFELAPDGDGTRLRLTHTGIETFNGDEHPEYLRHNYDAGWNELIGTSLKAFVEARAKA